MDKTVFSDGLTRLMETSGRRTEIGKVISYTLRTSLDVPLSRIRKASGILDQAECEGSFPKENQDGYGPVRICLLPGSQPGTTVVEFYTTYQGRGPPSLVTLIRNLCNVYSSLTIGLGVQDEAQYCVAACRHLIDEATKGDFDGQREPIGFPVRIRRDEELG